MKSELVPVNFDFGYEAERVLLVTKPEGGDPSVLQMDRVGPSRWRMKLELRPGVYRFRYYAGDDKQITYCGPAWVSGGILDGMDARVEVAPVSPGIRRVLDGESQQLGAAL